LRLVDLFPGSTARVLDALLSKPGGVWMRSHVASTANLDERTVRRVLTRLAVLGIVRFDRQFRVAVVSLNDESPVVRALLDLYEALEKAENTQSQD
jgi:DNA-binding transcriptional ArsR family regulator